MATIEIKMELCAGNLLRALEKASAGWDERKNYKFSEGWRVLKREGAEMAEANFVGGRVVVYPSEDFTLYCQRWGVFPSHG